MMKRRLAVTLTVLAAVYLVLLLSGCMGNPRSETIIIPDTVDEQMNGGGTGQSFQVKTIYRLPVSTSNKVRIMGWTNQADILGLSAESEPALDSSRRLQRLSPPYEQFKPMQSASPYTDLYELSPDGRHIVGITKSQTGYSLTLLSLADGQEKHVSAPPNEQWQLRSRNVQWSGNSRFVAYLVSGEGRAQLRVVVYDTLDGTLKLYPLTGLQDYGYGETVAMSDDGSGVLVETGKTVALAERNGDGFAVQYDHPSGSGESSWVNDDQFAFLGTDGTLFQYDRRNGELSVLLEKVGSFRLSPDRKAIAYTQNEKDAIFAGKLQGNNVLYREAVYQGVFPLQMIWSPGNDALLVDGRKPFSRASEQLEPLPATMPSDELYQPFIIKFQ